MHTGKNTDASTRRDAAKPEPPTARPQAPLEWDAPMYRVAVDQLDQAAERMNLDPNIWERLRTRQRAHVVSFPFRRDDHMTVETVSYFEWIQGLQQFCWSEEVVNRKQIDPMNSAYRSVENLAKEKRGTLRTAALMRGIGRVKEAKHVRGVFP